MFIELSEFLRCPRQHPDAFCVVMPLEMSGRSIVRGVIGCSACRAEYPITDAVAVFGEPPPPPAVASGSVDVQAVHALVGLESPGGYVVLLGAAAHLGRPLSGLQGGIHLVGVNPPASVQPGPHLTLLRAADRIPLRHGMARSVVVGPEYAAGAWLEDAARVLLRGLRLVVLSGAAAVVGVEELARGPELWVGQKR